MIKKLTKQQIEQIIFEHNKGTSKKGLAIKYEVGIKTINKALSENGIKSSFVRFDKTSKEKAQEMALNGASDVEISAETGISLGLASQYVKRVEKEMMEIAENESLIKAVPLEKTRYIVINGTSYTDITDFVAGI